MTSQIKTHGCSTCNLWESVSAVVVAVPATVMGHIIAVRPVSCAPCMRGTRVAEAGKSSIAALLLRLYDPASGEVTLDGVPLTALDQGWLRRRIGSVAQEPALLSGTVRDIICYGDPGASQVRPVVALPAETAHSHRAQPYCVTRGCGGLLAFTLSRHGVHD